MASDPPWTRACRVTATASRPPRIVARFRAFSRGRPPAVWGAAVAEHRIGRLAVCPRCGTPFGVCRACDRGHVYCGRACSGLARRDSRRRARRRHRQSPEGRLDHRDRERARRRRRREAARVGDHSFAGAGPSVRLHALKEEMPRDAPFRPSPAGARLHCAVCQRPLRGVSPELLGRPVGRPTRAVAPP